MRKVKFYLGTGFACSAHEEEISEIFHDWYEGKLDASWWDIEE